MSLYNQLFGENEDAMALLGMIGITRNEFQRYRDVYLNKEGNRIIVLTRLGGRNRNEYKQTIKNIKKNPFYAKDYDDKFDATYAYFEFLVPHKYEDVCKKMAPAEDRPTIKELFDKEIAEANIPGSAASKRMESIAEQILGAMNDKGCNGIKFIGL